MIAIRRHCTYVHCALWYRISTRIKDSCHRIQVIPDSVHKDPADRHISVRVQIVPSSVHPGMSTCCRSHFSAVKPTPPRIHDIKTAYTFQKFSRKYMLFFCSQMSASLSRTPCHIHMLCKPTLSLRLLVAAMHGEGIHIVIL